MRGSHKHAALTTEIAHLRERQLEDLRIATFLGWELETVMLHDRRESQIAELVRQLARLDETSFPKGS